LANKLSLLFVILIAFVVTFAACAVLVEYWHPNTGTITAPALELYIDDILYLNETALDWGPCEAGYTYSIENMTVLNVGNTALTVSFVTEQLPVGWTLEWEPVTQIVQPDAQIGGWLNLTIPIDATEWGTWGFYIRGE